MDKNLNLKCPQRGTVPFSRDSHAEDGNEPKCARDTNYNEFITTHIFLLAGG